MDSGRKHQGARTAGLAAVLAFLVGGVAWQRDVGAIAGSGERPVVVPVTPFRLVDTRPAPDGPIGGGAAPFGGGEVRTYAAAGVNAVPGDATGVIANVTVINATADTFVTLWPAGMARPLASTLNPAPGRTTFNAAAVDLSGGQFSVYNHAGSVDVIIDITGYLVDHNHDDQYLEQNQPIVLAQGAGGWRTASTSAPVTFEVLGPDLIASGTVSTAAKSVGYSLPLIEPTLVGGTHYALTTVEYCIRSITAGNVVKVDIAGIYSDELTGALPLKAVTLDQTDRTAVGCYSVAATTTPGAAHALVLTVALVGAATTGSVIISEVKATFVPI